MELILICREIMLVGARSMVSAFVRILPMSPRLHVFLRLIAAVIGGYALVASLVFLFPLVFAAAGMARAEAVTLSSVLGLLMYLCILIWSLYTRSLRQLWLIMAVAMAFYLYAVVGYGK